MRPRFSLAACRQPLVHDVPSRRRCVGRPAQAGGWVPRTVRGRLTTCRALGPGPGWPKWLSRLRGKSGAYVIRECQGWGIRSCAGGTVVYVGESHTAGLYGTLTRHFQKWNGSTAGTTYDRARCSVAVVVTSDKRERGAPGFRRAEVAQQQLIEELNPRDNSYSLPEPEADAVPF